MIHVQGVMLSLEWCYQCNPGLGVDPGTYVNLLLWDCQMDYVLGLRAHFLWYSSKKTLALLLPLLFPFSLRYSSLCHYPSFIHSLLISVHLLTDTWHPIKSTIPQAHKVIISYPHYCLLLLFPNHSTNFASHQVVPTHNVTQQIWCKPRYF
jgi:hypothetical protein